MCTLFRYVWIRKCSWNDGWSTSSTSPACIFITTVFDLAGDTGGACAVIVTCVHVWMCRCVVMKRIRLSLCYFANAYVWALRCVLAMVLLCQRIVWGIDLMHIVRCHCYMLYIQHNECACMWCMYDRYICAGHAFLLIRYVCGWWCAHM